MPCTSSTVETRTRGRSGAADAHRVGGPPGELLSGLGQPGRADARPCNGRAGHAGVRLIGVDTLESVHPTKPVERFAREATRFLRELVDRKAVRVEYEPAGARLDRYGRRLAYLYLEPGGLFVNREIIARGYGHAYTKYPFRFMEEFRAVERKARESQVGLWAPEAGPDEGEGEPDERASLETTVYVTKTGTKYHREGCRSLARSAIAMPLGRASARYMPCGACHPP